MEGPLSKWTNMLEGWQYRWFILDDATGLLSYYTSNEKMMRGSRRGCVRLKGAIVGIDGADDSTFTITCDNKMFHFQARDSDERDKWVGGLEDTIVKHSQPQQIVDSILPTGLADFDRRMQESDVYLQILIEQLQNLDQKIETIEDEDMKQKYINVKSVAEGMVESVKHSIVLLQIAKNSTFTSSTPVTTQPLIIVNTQSDKKLSEQDMARVKRLGLSEVDEDIDVDIIEGVEEGKECEEITAGREESGNRYGDVTSTNTGSIRPSLIPVTSYSSSDEDEFVDAEDDYDVPSPRLINIERREVGNLHVDMPPNVVVRSDPPKSPSKVNADLEEGVFVGGLPAAKPHDAGAMSEGGEQSEAIDSYYDSSDEDELESMEEHGSMIMHLLSQLKIGMDLTKVTLPTFILEKKSLLEMYADFFAHPDLFANIPDYTTPEMRMVQVVRWYLSAFHAGRRGSLAKKPYNPLLGEVFQCFWDVPNNVAATNGGLVDTTESRVTVGEGPVPWATKNHVTFVAEQVSHHPPISAFYAEHRDKDICVGGHIWTKSKFLGLSIGVEMVGQACLSVLRHQEEYILTFPSGYGRSIFNVPWVELGGKAGISCAKTGYYATVDFLTKPFYGGKKHQVSVEAFAPSDKKPFLTVSGAWNGVMSAKYKDELKGNVFVDTLNMKIEPKRVRPIKQQNVYESRRIWQHVTQALKKRDVDQATHHKHSLERRQREEAKYRNEHGLAWENRHFKEVGGHWVYTNPLERRVNED